MASKLSNVLRSSYKIATRSNAPAIFKTPVRSLVCTETGAILDKPARHRFGLLKVLVVTVPFLYLGATGGKEVSAFLEENDIFVPSDDDDD
jgi:hypothetical protein